MPERRTAESPKPLAVGAKINGAPTSSNAVAASDPASSGAPISIVLASIGRIGASGAGAHPTASHRLAAATGTAARGLTMRRL